MLSRLLYWLAVLAVSLGLVTALILLLESRDGGQLQRERGSRVTLAAAECCSAVRSVPARTRLGQQRQRA